MSRKILYTIIACVCILLLVILVIGYLSLGSNKLAGNGGAQSNPFGGFFSIFRGTNNNSGTAGTTTSPTVNIQADNGESVTIPRLRQVSNTPTAGATFMSRVVATSTLTKGVLKTILVPTTFIRYVERATGHIFETKPEVLSSIEISNTTIPKIYDASFVKGGTAILYRYLDTDENTIETYYANLVLPKVATTSPSTSSGQATSTKATSTPAVIATSTTTYQLVGSILPPNLFSLAISPAKDRIFYLQNTALGSTGVIALPDNTSKKQIFTNPLKEWLVNWSGTNTIFLTTKPSGGVAGYLFSLNVNAGTFTKIFGNVAGLTVLPSPDLTSILYSANNGSNFSLNVYTPANGLSSGVSLKTLPEKCIWSEKMTAVVYCAVPLAVPSGSYPDVWYQGAVSFTDNIWKINVRTGDRTLVAQPNQLTRVSMDATNLTLDPNENYLMFTNKKDLTLWNLLITPPVPPAPLTSTSTTATSTATTTATTSTSVRSTILR